MLRTRVLAAERNRSWVSRFHRTIAVASAPGDIWLTGADYLVAMFSSMEAEALIEALRQALPRFREIEEEYFRRIGTGEIAEPALLGDTRHEERRVLAHKIDQFEDECDDFFWWDLPERLVAGAALSKAPRAGSG